MSQPLHNGHLFTMATFLSWLNCTLNKYTKKSKDIKIVMEEWLTQQFPFSYLILKFNVALHSVPDSTPCG